MAMLQCPTMTTNPSSASTKRPFIPARPTPWLIKAAQEFVRAELAMKNQLQLPESDLSIFRELPQGSGVVLTSNHADETDPRVCIELSRLSGKQFISMCNREAFDENFGLAGWALQRLGHFSVERGAHDANAKTFAIDVLKQGKDILVIFPEGEIFYMNEILQPFHSGAIDIAMQAILDRRKEQSDWTAFILPMAIKYHHEKPLEPILEKRIARLESVLGIHSSETSLPRRLLAIQKQLLAREERQYGLPSSPSDKTDLEEEIRFARRAILAEVERKHGEQPIQEGHRAIDESWKLGAELRESLAKQTDSQKRAELENDIATLREVAQLASWHPHYYETTSSFDRMAEVVLKLERELFRLRRPKQLTSRKVFVRLAPPVDLAPFVDEYIRDSHSVRHTLTAQLQTKIQSMLDGLVKELSV